MARPGGYGVSPRPENGRESTTKEVKLMYREHTFKSGYRVALMRFAIVGCARRCISNRLVGNGFNSGREGSINRSKSD